MAADGGSVFLVGRPLTRRGKRSRAQTRWRLMVGVYFLGENR